MKMRRFHGCFTLGMAAFALLAVVGLATGRSLALGKNFPDWGDTTGTANIYNVSGQTQFVRNTDSDLAIWFTEDHGQITIEDANMCSSIPSPDYMEKADGHGFPDLNGGDNITIFHVDAGEGKIKLKVGGTWEDKGKTDTEYGKVDFGADCGSITFKFKDLTDKQAGYYKATLDVRHLDHWSGGWDGIMNYYRITSDNDGTRIGSRAGKTGYTVTQEQVDQKPENIDYNVPFGTRCDLDDAREDATIVMFDLDNAGGSGAQKNGDVYVQLEQFPPGTKLADIQPGKGTRIKFKNPGAGSLTDNDKTWTPASKDNIDQFISFKAQKEHKYLLEIKNVYYNNTIQYSVPYAQIYAAGQCDHKPTPNDATVTPYASVTVDGKDVTGRNDIEPGKNLVFHNSIAVSGTPKAGDTYAWKIYGVGATRSGSTSLSSGVPSVDVTVANAQPGLYCRTTSVDKDSLPGYAQIGGDELPDKQACVTVVARPYFSVTGGDIAATGTIRSWNQDSGSYTGAGSTMAALAGSTSGIKNFVTGRGFGWVVDGTGLAFANTTKNLGSHIYGGGYTFSPSSAPSYTCPDSFLGGNISSTSSGTYCADHSINLSGTVGTGNHITIVATSGNVTIDGNLTYAGYSSLAEIPSLTVIAPKGNILVNNNVTKIHGAFYAPSGTFISCASGGAQVADNAIYDQCRTQLKIYGAVSAKTFTLNRTFGDFNTTFAPAEEFIYSPELWLAPTGSTSGSSTSPYDYYVSLPPVL